INPRNIWLMVVLIVGIGLSGYIAYKFFGEKTGLLLSGLLGGMVSSTATTVSFSRQSKLSKLDCRTATIVILLASTVVYVRVMLEMAAVAPSLLRVAAGPITVLLLIGLAAVAIFSRWSQKTGEKLPEPTNPSELKSALFFALLYCFVLFMVAFTTDKFGQFGNRGLYLIAFLSGLTDVDAITLSTAQLVRLDRLPVSEAWRMVVAAVLSNLFFKLGTVLFLGARLLKVQLSIILTMTIIVGLLLLKFWPA
ncbi:MAG: MgtC/SapB family protein, partial [Blastocatellia bacterium]